MNASYYRSIRKNILISMIFVPVIPFLISMGIGYYHFTRSLEQGAAASMKRIVDDHRQMIDSFLLERLSDLEFILNAYTFDDLSQSDVINGVFKNLQARSAAFVDMGVFDRSGSHVAYYGPYALKWKVYREENWFKKVMMKGYYISDIFLGYRQVPHFVIAVRKEENDKAWVLRATVDTQKFNNLVESVRIGRTGEAYLLNAEGMLQTRPRSGGGLMQKPADKVSFPQAQDQTAIFIGPDASGETCLYATTWLKGINWLLVVRQQEDDAYKSLHSASYAILFIFIMGLAASIGFAFYLTERIIQKMKEMDSEKENLGQQLIRAQRLAELGEMAAGFAHEINNPLQIIRSEQSLVDMNFSELKEQAKLEPSDTLDEINDSMSQIALQIERCAGITQAILKFGRQSEPQLEDVDLRDFIPQVIAMVEKKAHVNGVHITRNLAEETPPVHGDAGQLQQVLLNLFNNAMDAIAQRHAASGGQLVISSKRGENGTVEIMVKDNGCGVPSDDLKNVFSPFFTTKPVGKGTGLGLSVCYGIIRAMDGEINVSSTVGVGTEFTITLPAAV